MDDGKVELDVGNVIEEIVYDDMNIKCVKLIYILKVQHDWNALFALYLDCQSFIMYMY